MPHCWKSHVTAHLETLNFHLSSFFAGIVGVQPEEVIERTQKCVQDQMLFRCLTCEALMEYHLAMDQFEKGGSAYTLAVNTHKVLDPTKLYSFPTLGESA